MEYDSNVSIYGLGIRAAPEGSGLPSRRSIPYCRCRMQDVASRQFGPFAPVNAAAPLTRIPQRIPKSLESASPSWTRFELLRSAHHQRLEWPSSRFEHLLRRDLHSRFRGTLPPTTVSGYPEAIRTEHLYDMATFRQLGLLPDNRPSAPGHRLVIQARIRGLFRSTSWSWSAKAASKMITIYRSLLVSSPSPLR